MPIVVALVNTDTLCTVAEAKLQIGKSAVVDDVELLSYCQAIVDPIEDFCGAILQNNRSEIIHGSGDTLILPSERVVSVTSVTGYAGGTGTVWTAGDLTYSGTSGYRVEPASGLIRAVGTGSFNGDYQVVYVEGMTSVPSSVNMAARFLVQDLWLSQQGGAGLPPVFQDDTITHGGVALPQGRRAFELLSRYRRTPRVA